MEGAHTLVVMRHARSEEYAAGGDFERDLTAEGRADAAEAGRWLAGEVAAPDTAYVSGALRARATWDELAAAAGWECEAVVDSLLYTTDEYGVLDILHATDDDARTVVVVGHNPIVGVLAQMLDDGEAPGELSDQLLGGLPTCAAVVFDVATPWAELGPAGARLRAVHVGRA